MKKYKFKPSTVARLAILIISLAIITIHYFPIAEFIIPLVLLIFVGASAGTLLVAAAIGEFD